MVDPTPIRPRRDQTEKPVSTEICELKKNLDIKIRYLYKDQLANLAKSLNLIDDGSSTLKTMIKSKISEYISKNDNNLIVLTKIMKTIERIKNNKTGAPVINQPKRIRFNEIAEFSLLYPIIEPRSLVTMSQADFVLGHSELVKMRNEMMSDKAVHLILRFCTVNVLSRDMIPPSSSSLTIMLNNTLIDYKNLIIHTPEVINLTPIILNLPTKCKYSIFIKLGQHISNLYYGLFLYTIDMTKVKHKKIQRQSYNDCEKFFISKLSNITGAGDDVEFCNNVTLNLLDPLTLDRIKLPCRSRYCQHIDCFDGDIFLQSFSAISCSTFNCIICGVDFKFSDMFVDAYCEYLLTLYPDLESVYVTLDDKNQLISSPTDPNKKEKEFIVLDDDDDDGRENNSLLRKSSSSNSHENKRAKISEYCTVVTPSKSNSRRASAENSENSKPNGTICISD